MTRPDSWARSLRDPGRPIGERADAARALAALATDDALSELAAVLDGSAWTLRARIAESLGLADHPRARGLVGALLDDPDEEVACAAVRGLAWRPGGEAVVVLTRLLNDDRRRLPVRCTAASTLASVGGRTTCEALAGAIADTPHDALREAALAALAARPLRDTRDLFAWLLGRADGPHRVPILEALGEASGDVPGLAAPYLADVAAEVREAAALAIAGAARAGEVGALLVAALAREPETAVRFALYHALSNQLAFDVDPVVRRVLAERSADLRLAGSAAVAAEVARRPDAAARFDGDVVPVLLVEALDETKPDGGLAAVGVLRAAMTAASRRALRTIAADAPAPTATAARAALNDRERGD